MIEIFCYNKGLKRIEDLDKFDKNKGKIWIDVTAITAEESKWLGKTFNLHPLTEEDLMHNLTRIKVEEFKEYMFAVFYGIQKNSSLELIELNFVLGKNFLITNHIPPIDSVNQLKANDDKLKLMFEKGVDHMCAYILDNEIDNYFPILENIDDEVEEIEHEISDKLNRDIMQHILKLKRTITFIKKISMPQREKLSFLAKNDYKFISEKSIPYFRDVYDHSIRVSDALDNYREAASNTFEAYMSAVNNNMNEVMKTLSVIATIALPMTAISSIYGTNFEFLPGIHSHYGFIIMIGAMMVIVIMMMIFFKRRGWF